jgi:hypothetical protein
MAGLRPIIMMLVVLLLLLLLLLLLQREQLNGERVNFPRVGKR